MVTVVGSPAADGEEGSQHSGWVQPGRGWPFHFSPGTVMGLAWDCQKAGPPRAPVHTRDLSPKISSITLREARDGSDAVACAGA